MSDLALLGGAPIREKLFPAHKFIAEEEKAARSDDPPPRLRKRRTRIGRARGVHEEASSFSSLTMMMRFLVVVASIVHVQLVVTFNNYPHYGCT